MVRINFFIEVEFSGTRATGREQKLALGIEMKVINAFRDFQSLELFSRLSIEYDDVPAAAADKQAMIRLVIGHGDVRFPHSDRPGRYDGALVAVDHFDLILGTVVEEEPLACALERHDLQGIAV